jgi:hypothetical protein
VKNQAAQLAVKVNVKSFLKKGEKGSRDMKVKTIFGL